MRAFLKIKNDNFCEFVYSYYSTYRITYQDSITLCVNKGNNKITEHRHTRHNN